MNRRVVSLMSKGKKYRDVNKAYDPPEKTGGSKPGSLAQERKAKRHVKRLIAILRSLVSSGRISRVCYTNRRRYLYLLGPWSAIRGSDMEMWSEWFMDRRPNSTTGDK